MRIPLKILIKKGGRILAKTKLSSSFVHIPLPTVNIYFEFQVSTSNDRDMTKCLSFCITTTRTRLQQYLWFSPKTAQ